MLWMQGVPTCYVPDQKAAMWQSDDVCKLGMSRTPRIPARQAMKHDTAVTSRNCVFCRATGSTLSYVGPCPNVR